ncbi:uncharacterized protein B0P05DRAFT_466383 [Gilbertella persicaria]|uniref:uncharacterized protein n=1 Tax=Gilbertella persicaria TaxID=101096 RepID=UPI00221E3D41|nr:uncharacterized protein B0P05DRAFT_466383 [Gilbertella persicaria]KAI8085938.1 hypothetical protein B0P05DRAFT_466383 [Gilbertella persicaria]
MTGSKKKHGKEIGVPAESIENFKPKKPKASEEKTKPKLKKPKAPGSKIIIEEQPEVNEINKEEKEAVEKKKKKKKAEVSSTSSATKEKEYCHPNDAISPTRSNRPRFERYLDPKIYTKMVEKGELHEGILRVNRRSRTDAYVTCENLGGDIFINGQHDRNRALDGDTVIVQLLDLETIWAKKKEQMIQKREERHKTALERPPRDEGEDDKAKPKYVGKVVAISNTSKLQTCSGTLSVHRHSSQDEQSLKADGEDENGPTESDGQKQIKIVWFKPVDLRKPLMAIPIRHAPLDIIENPKKYTNLLMVAKITRWPIDSPHPLGSVLRELGHIGNIVAETQAVLEDNHIIEQPFGNKALKCLPQVPWSISQEEIDKRRDLRDYRIFTIDPATAKDLDDAVHIIKLGKDEFEVGVHIADVSHFVHQHTALDHEAFDRGTSTYLCDRVIPMLPSLLCEQLCSLNPAVERLAFSVIWKMDGAGNIKDTWFGKSVIKSCAKLAYEDAQQVIEGHGLPSTASVKSFAVSEVEQDIKYLFQLSKQMRERRFAGGALSINSIRLSFKLNELGEPCAVSIYEQKDANRLIEEFMLCANTSVAQKIASHYPNDALLRQHSPPHEKSLDEFIRIAEGMGYSFDGSSAGALQKSFNAIESEDVRAVLRLLAVKPMQRAKYFCTGSCDAAKYGHYALNIPLYTHFTSPIRRFADIIVHRQLEAALKNKQSCGYKKDAVTKVAIQCNERKEGAKNSQDMNIQLYLAHYLYMIETKTKKPVICTAIVTQILKDCFEVLISEYGIEKRIHMDALPIKKYVYDPRKHALSVYWQEGIEATREYDMNRKLDEDYREPSGTQLYLNQDSSDDNDESTATKTIYEIPQELLNDNLIDNEAKSQRFETFSKLQVRIQVNVERSPPIVNIYPVNPFM